MARDLVGKCYVGIYVYDENGICLEDASKIVSTDGSAKWKIYTVLTQLPENAAGVEFEAWPASSVKEYKVQIDAVMMQISEWEVGRLRLDNGKRLCGHQYNDPCL